MVLIVSRRPLTALFGGLSEPKRPRNGLEGSRAPGVEVELLERGLLDLRRVVLRHVLRVEAPAYKRLEPVYWLNAYV